MSICAACGHDNPSGARFCGSCGSPLEQPSQSRATMQPDEKPARRRRRPAAFIGVGVLVVVGIALLALSMVRIVGAGEVGVVHTFGVVDPEPRPPGTGLGGAVGQLRIHERPHAAVHHGISGRRSQRPRRRHNKNSDVGRTFRRPRPDGVVRA